ncbi:MULTISPECIES: DMT family transporter [Cobetia]|uniref:DMT family transporter n=1 Tax=Cobetia crustatorum TaxID=553385 RepID=A0A558HXE6_9GAMM|nr:MULTISPECIES: DMT family transporter [Cobetia]TVU73816.1 DMT family transporter [Cobetia crustatorum]
MPGPAAPPANQPQALMAIHLGIALLGGTALFSKSLPLSALDITTWRSLLAGLFLLWIARLKWNVSLRLSGRDWALIGLAGLLMAVHWVSYFHAMQVSSVATGMLALFTYPIFIVLLEPWVEGTRLKARDLAAAALVCVGVWLLVPGGNGNVDGDSLAGVLWGVFSGLLFAIRNLLVRYRLSHINPVLSMSLQALGVVVLTLPFASGDIMDSSPGTGIAMLVLAIVFTATPHALMTFALGGLKAKTVGMIGCMQPVYGVLLAWLILGEVPTWMTLVGGSFIVAAAALETLRRN